MFGANHSQLLVGEIRTGSAEFATSYVIVEVRLIAYTAICMTLRKFSSMAKSVRNNNH